MRGRGGGRGRRGGRGSSGGGSGDDPSRRARRLYNRRVTPRRTKDMRRLLDEATAETAALVATTVLCEYLNRWNAAGPAEVAVAKAAIDRALALNPKLYLAHYAKGFLCRTEGKHAAALQAFEDTINYAPKFARAYAQKGDELVYLGRPREGIAAVEEAMKISERSSVRGFFYWVIGRAHFFLKEDDKAIYWLRRSVRNWPDVWYPRLYLVSAHAHSGQRAAMRRVYKAFDKRFPGHTLAQVIEDEGLIRHDHPLVLDGRERFREGLRLAGMPLQPPGLAVPGE